MKKILLLLALIWVSKDFFILEGAVDFINALTPDQRMRAYVIALNSQRSNFANGYYSVIYPKDGDNHE